MISKNTDENNIESLEIHANIAFVYSRCVLYCICTLYMYIVYAHCLCMSYMCNVYVDCICLSKCKTKPLIDASKQELVQVDSFL